MVSLQIIHHWAKRLCSFTLIRGKEGLRRVFLKKNKKNKKKLDKIEKM
jgi:hypothetical protein